jgi:anti-anti-sigma regulatory factor
MVKQLWRDIITLARVKHLVIDLTVLIRLDTIAVQAFCIILHRLRGIMFFSSELPATFGAYSMPLSLNSVEVER